MLLALVLGVGRAVAVVVVLLLGWGYALADRRTPATSTKWTPEVRARLKALVDRYQAYDKVAEAARRDPVLRQVKTEWSKERVNEVVRSYRGEFGRLLPEKVPLTPELWQDARAWLLAYPGHSHPAVARMMAADKGILARHGRFDVQVLKGVVGKYGGKEFARERDQALLDQLIGRLTKLQAGGKIAERMRLISRGGLPMSGTRFNRLRKSFPGALDEFVGEVYDQATEPQLAVIRELMLANPSLTVEEMAPVVEADRRLRGTKWNRDRLNRLVQKDLLPGKQERDDALASAAADIWEKLPDDTPVYEALATIQRAHPGATPWRIFTLAESSPRLPKGFSRGQPRLLRQLKAHEPMPLPPLPDTLRMAPTLARQVRFHRPLVAEALASNESEARWMLLQAVDEVIRLRGYNDGILRPPDLEGARGLAPALLRQIYGRRQGWILSAAEIAKALPNAAAALAESPAATAELRRAVGDEAFALIARLYRREVLIEGRPLREFTYGRLPFEAMQKLMAARPDVFLDPQRSAFSSDRLDLLEARYLDVLAGKLSAQAFFKSTRLNRDELRILQFVYPKRFPPTAKAPGTLLTDHEKGGPGDGEVDRLSALWIEKVVPRLMSIAEYQRTTGVSPTVLWTLRKDETKFPPLARKGLVSRDLYKEELAIVSRKAHQVRAADPLATLDDIRAVVNLMPGFVDRFGELGKGRYYDLYKFDEKAFPDMRAVDEERLKGMVRAIVEAHPEGIGPRAIVSEMQKTVPRFRVSRLRLMQRADENLVPEQRRAPSTKAQRRKDALALAALKRNQQETSLEVLGASLGDRFNRSYVWRIRRENEDLFTDGEPTPQPVWERRTHPMAKLFQLAFLLAPPGAGWIEAARVLNELLVERGLPPYESANSGKGAPSTAPVQTFKKFGLPSLQAQGAVRASEAYAEYRAAMPGKSEDAVFQRMQEDYPSLTNRAMNTYREMWRKRPQDYPALRRRGMPEKPRYLGGWNVERALLSDPVTARQLARESQWARIPMRLPLLDELVTDQVRAERPLSTHNVLTVSHLLGSSFALARALKAAGASGKGMIMVGTPYGTNEAVKEALLADGFDVRVPPLSVKAYKDEVARALDDVIDRHKKNQRPIVILDDGGLISEILHADPKKYGRYYDKIKIVEQTTRGINAAFERVVRVPIINVARSESKKAEGEFIGLAVATKVSQGLARLGTDVRGKTVVVMGYGVVGSATAAHLKAAGARVLVVESNPTTAALVPKSMRPSSKAAALKQADVVIGATGEESLKAEHLSLLKTGTVIASASSKQVEFAMPTLIATGTRVELKHDNPLVKLPTARYTLNGRQITVLGDGWPVNFDGDVEDVAPEEIQLTRAAMLAGALQAAGLRPGPENRRVIPLDPIVDNRILGRWRELVGHERRPIGDPANWRRDLLSLGARWSDERAR